MAATIEDLEQQISELKSRLNRPHVAETDEERVERIAKVCATIFGPVRCVNPLAGIDLATIVRPPKRTICEDRGWGYVWCER